MVCRFPDGYSAKETLVLLQLAWRLGSPAIAAHCASRIFRISAGSIVSPADIDIPSWHLTAQHLELLAAFSPKLQAALGKALVPIYSLTDDDVKVLLAAEEILCQDPNDRQHAPAVVNQASDAGTVLCTASFENQSSQLQRNHWESAVAHQALGATNVQETLRRDDQAQLQSNSAHSLTFTGFSLCTAFSLYTPSRMPRLGCKQTPGKQNSHLPCNVTSSSQDASPWFWCMPAPLQAGLRHGLR